MSYDSNSRPHNSWQSSSKEQNTYSSLANLEMQDKASHMPSSIGKNEWNRNVLSSTGIGPQQKESINDINIGFPSTNCNVMSPVDSSLLPNNDNELGFNKWLSDVGQMQYSSKQFPSFGSQKGSCPPKASYHDSGYALDFSNEDRMMSNHQNNSDMFSSNKIDLASVMQPLQSQQSFSRSMDNYPPAMPAGLQSHQLPSLWSKSIPATTGSSFSLKNNYSGSNQDVYNFAELHNSILSKKLSSPMGQLSHIYGSKEDFHNASQYSEDNNSGFSMQKQQVLSNGVSSSSKQMMNYAAIRNYNVPQTGYTEQYIDSSLMVGQKTTDGIDDSFSSEAFPPASLPLGYPAVPTRYPFTCPVPLSNNYFPAAPEPVDVSQMNEHMHYHSYMPMYLGLGDFSYEPLSVYPVQPYYAGVKPFR